MLNQIQRALARQRHVTIRWVVVVLLAILSVFKAYHATGIASYDTRSYDQLLKLRMWGHLADPRIVILDIDEKSLDQMRAEFGRWPWPRETLASVLDWLNQQGSQAVVFDILFAEADTLNPASDQAFAQAVQSSSHSYFPILRLHPSNDDLSQVNVRQLQGFAHPLSPASKAPAPSVAVIAPAFEAIIETGRMGYHNIYADADGVNRTYRLWEDKGDWRLWSLPARIARDLGWALPDEPNQLIHFTKDKDAYARESFVDIWKKSQSRQGQQKDPRFENAIVIIGSTATGLFDLKVTPVDPIHPGVMVLANVIDNVKHQSFLRLLPAWSQVIVAWVSLALVVTVSTRIREDQMKWAAPVAPGMFMGLGFLSLHTGNNLYLDLAQSASNALLFFTVWALYLGWRTRYFGRYALEKNNPPLEVKSSALLRLDFQHATMQAVLDAVSTVPGVCSVIRLGAVNQPADTGIGQVHIASTGGEDELQQCLHQLHPLPSHTNVRGHAARVLNCHQFWQYVWDDMYQAEERWRNTHATH